MKEFDVKRNKLNDASRARFDELCLLIKDTVPDAEPKLWAAIPSFCKGDKFIRLLCFAGHINIEAAAAIDFKSLLGEYSFTPKGMLQITHEQRLNEGVLREIFLRTLNE